MMRLIKVRRALAERLTRAGRTRRRHGRYDELTYKVIDRVVVDGSNSIDVGAHEGAILWRMVDRSPAGRQFAFEPIPELAASLREKFPSVEVHELALADVPGRTEFIHVVSNPGYSGLRERTYDRPREELERIEVVISRLDDVIPPDLPIALIKVDVEGAELGVFRGGLETIRRWKPHIVFEHGLGAADHYGTTPDAVYDLLVDDCGLRIGLLDRFLKGRRPLTRAEFLDEFVTGRNYYFIAYPTEDA